MCTSAFILLTLVLLLSSSVDSYKITKISSLTSLLLNNDMKRHLVSKYEMKDISIKMNNNDNNDISTSINNNNNNNNNNKILKYSLITMSSILLMPMITLAVDSDSITAFQIARPIFDISVNLLSFLFICRTVISWYPKTDLNAFPYNIAAWPTEPLLAPVRDLVPPAFGVDVSSIVWVAVLSFLREILIGQQGILTLIEKSG